jgi:hypothetical protein
MTPDPDHPLASATDRLIVFRAICAILAGGLALITVLIGLVVRFALDGQPIAGNAVQVAGVSVVTLAAVGAAAIAPMVALAISSAQQRSALTAAAANPPDPDEDRNRLLDIFAASLFVEYGIVESAGFACALLYHLTADWVLLAAVFGMIAFMIARFPTTTRAIRWYDEAAMEMAALREVAVR